MFWLGCLISLGLLLLVVLTPMIVSEEDDSPRWLTLFALDGTVRSVSILSALGLFVTCCIFFRATTPEE